MDLNEKTIVVTGVSSRIGPAAEHQFGCLRAALIKTGVTSEAGPVIGLSNQDGYNTIAVNLNRKFYAAGAYIPASQKAGGRALVFAFSCLGHTIGLLCMPARAAAKSLMVGNF